MASSMLLLLRRTTRPNAFVCTASDAFNGLQKRQTHAITSFTRQSCSPQIPVVTESTSIRDSSSSHLAATVSFGARKQPIHLVDHHSLRAVRALATAKGHLAEEEDSRDRIEDDFPTAEGGDDEATVAHPGGEQEPRKSTKGALAKANLPPSYTPGQALFVLQNHAAGGNFIRLTDFRDLCLAARPGKKKDAIVILTALREFKRTAKFILHKHGARVAMEGMMRSLLPDEEEIPGEARVEAALFVADAFLDEKTGLYYAAKTEAVDALLANLHQGVVDSELIIERKIADEQEVSEESEVAGDDDAEKKESTAEKTIRVTREVIELLIKRCLNPQWKMKKRAARKYNKAIQVRSGAYPSTIHLGCQICLAVDGPAAAREMVLNPFLGAKGKPSEETLDMLELAEEQLKMQEAASAASAEAAEAGDIDPSDVEPEEASEEEQDEAGEEVPDHSAASAEVENRAAEDEDKK